MMDAKFDQVLAHYTRRIEAEDKLWRTENPGTLFARRDDFLLPVGEEVGRFLHALIIARGAKVIVELGTSYGYSTLFLADAARQTGGKVHSFELSADKQDYARAQLAAGGLVDYVEWHLGDAVALLDEISDGVEFVLIDLWKDLYIPCFEKLYPKLANNGVIAADNMLEPAMSRPDAEAYRSVVRACADLQTVLLPIGSGIELSCLWRVGVT
jgi:predicted O-methyltransferase YrrM